MSTVAVMGSVSQTAEWLECVECLISEHSSAATADEDGALHAVREREPGSRLGAGGKRSRDALPAVHERLTIQYNTTTFTITKHTKG